MVHLSGLCARSAWVGVVTLVLSAVALTGCSEDTTGVDTGSMDVTTATTGASLDPDGYVLTVDGGEAQSIGVNETVTLAGLEPGDHEVALTELTPNCSPTGANPQTVTVVAGESVSASFEVECGFVSLEIAYTRVGARGGVFVTTETGSYTFNLRSNSISGQFIYRDPTWSPDGARIAFLETEVIDIFEDFLDLVWVANVDGSNPVQVTNEQGYFVDLAWSPDGTKIAYAGWLDDDADIYVMDTDGSNPVNLSNYPGDDRAPAWSPDGTKIAFTAFRDGNPEIYVMDADGANQLRLTDDPGWDNLPAWSPDGAKIAFTTDRDGNSEIYVMDADGSHLVNLTNDAGEQSDPAWSPDGSRIAFANDWDIYVMDADGSNAVNLTNSPLQEFGPAWSPLPPRP